jgi:hypothetical protein
MLTEYLTQGVVGSECLHSDCVKSKPSVLDKKTQVWNIGGIILVWFRLNYEYVENPIPKPLCPPQTSLGLASDQTRANFLITWWECERFLWEYFAFYLWVSSHQYYLPVYRSSNTEVIQPCSLQLTAPLDKLLLPIRFFSKLIFHLTAFSRNKES